MRILSTAGDTATGNSTSGSVNAVTGTTVFLLGRFSTDGSPSSVNYDRMELWVNPTSLTLGTADATVDFNSGLAPSTGFGSFGMRVVNLAAGEEMRFDELRIDTALIGVVPEPASAGMLLGGLALASLVRRRRMLP